MADDAGVPSLRLEVCGEQVRVAQHLQGVALLLRMAHTIRHLRRLTSKVCAEEVQQWDASWRVIVRPRVLLQPRKCWRLLADDAAALLFHRRMWTMLHAGL